NCEIRGLVDARSETVGKKIREAEMQKLPFMLIVGDQEMDEGTVSVRRHGGADLGAMTVAALSDLIQKEINSTLKSF
ncbi:MAG: His/Gly/Thr/Pro-type tRNA ligase C-terminal domain-containing protein, partial [Robiginitalea sp.]|nr:His/Gly/Thr/Pro-type tRNA ligase C-terminal domain-containing protein [Robiginitalea sp.]